MYLTSANLIIKFNYIFLFNWSMKAIVYDFTCAY